MPDSALLSVLARALLAGEQDVPSIIARIKHSVGKRGLPGIARRYIAALAGQTRPNLREVKRFLLKDPGFPHIHSRAAKDVPIRHWLTEPQTMQPVAAARTWQLPVILSLGELAAWLRLTPGELDWFADPLHINRKRGDSPGESPLHHYTYTVISKRTGGVRFLESPKQHLKLLQRQILREILNNIPCHPAAHGFVPGRSIHTFTAPHALKPVVLRMDIQDFFPSLVAARVQAFFRTAGYPDAVASALAGISTNSVPASAWTPHHLQIGIEETAHLRQIYTRRHLPQGAPTSPALANLCAYRFDCRLAGLAVAAGATYTRYADDLAFSGNSRFARHSQPFADRVAAILLEEGFHAHYRKTRIMRPSVRQHLVGLVVNNHPNIPRDDYDRLKATLTNCLRHGADSQNHKSHKDFRAHLLGRLAFIATVNPNRAARLRALFDHISW